MYIWETEKPDNIGTRQTLKRNHWTRTDFGEIVDLRYYILLLARCSLDENQGSEY